MRRRIIVRKILSSSSDHTEKQREHHFSYSKRKSRMYQRCFLITIRHGIRNGKENLNLSIKVSKFRLPDFESIKSFYPSLTHQTLVFVHHCWQPRLFSLHYASFIILSFNRRMTLIFLHKHAGKSIAQNLKQFVINILHLIHKL